MNLKSYNYGDLLYIQEKFNDRLFRDRLVDIYNLEDGQLQLILKDMCLHIIDEIMEVLRELNWKMHKLYKNKELNREKIIEELVDIDKFHKNFLVLLDISEEEFVEEWNRKTKLVWDKYEKENG